MRDDPTVATQRPQRHVRASGARRGCNMHQTTCTRHTSFETSFHCAPMRCSPDSFGFSYSVRGGPAGEQRPVRNLFELAAEEPPMASVVLGARDALVLRSMLCCRRCRRHHHHGRSVWQDHRRWLLLVGGQPRFNESRSPATHWSFFVIDGRTTSILHRLAAGHHQRVLQLCCWRVCCCGSGPAALNSWMCTLI